MPTLCLGSLPLAIDMTPGKTGAPQGITIYQSGTWKIRHWYGNSLVPAINRLYYRLNGGSWTEITTGGRANVYPGDEVSLSLTTSDLLELALEGGTVVGGVVIPNGVPTFLNTSTSARGQRACQPAGLGGGWYFDWEDISPSDSTYNDSRTFVYLDGVVCACADLSSGWTVGRVGF